MISRLLDLGGDQVIAISRVLLAFGGLLAIYLDPDQPTQGEIGYLFVAGYAAFSVALLAVIPIRLARRWMIASHVVEIVLVCVIIAHTEGPTSPFFVYFTFVLLVAALHWQARGALLTGLLLSLVLIFLTTSQWLVSIPQGDIDRLVIRNVYLLVAAGLIAFLGQQLGESHQRLARIRLAQDLHDGVLQTLTAARMKLYKSAASREQSQELMEINELLSNEQRRIRTFVETARLDPPIDMLPSEHFPLRDLHAHRARLQDLWGCTIDLTVTPAEEAVPSRIGRALELIVAESVANAVTHGQANQVGVAIRREPNALQITVKDNGSGLKNAHGAYNLAKLRKLNLGPRSIRQRITELNGSLELTSSQNGLELQFRLPT